jgi:hypothetical protein
VQERLPACKSSRAVIEADDPRYLPCAVLQLPQVDELRFSDIGGIAGVRKTVYPDFDGAVALQGIHLERSRHQVPTLKAEAVQRERDEQLKAEAVQREQSERLKQEAKRKKQVQAALDRQLADQMYQKVVLSMGKSRA